MVDPQQMDKQSYDFLHKLYDLTKGSTLKSVEPSVIGEQLNCNIDDVRRLSDYLVDVGAAEYAQNGDSSQQLNITAKGATMIEGPIHETEN